MEEMTMATDERIQRLIQTFATDGHDVDPNARVKVYQESMAMAAVHPTATIGKTCGNGALTPVAGTRRGASPGKEKTNERFST